MTKPPERIWAYPSNVSGWTSANAHDRNIFGATEYIRADLVMQRTPDPAVQAMVEALQKITDAYELHLFNSKGDYFNPWKVTEIIRARSALAAFYKTD